jgi:hypothetical protein
MPGLIPSFFASGVREYPAKLFPHGTAGFLNSRASSHCTPSTGPTRIQGRTRLSSSFGQLAIRSSTSRPRKQNGSCTFTGQADRAATVKLHDQTLKVEKGHQATPNLHLIADSATWLGFLASVQRL